MSTKFVQNGDKMHVTLAGTVSSGDADVVGTGLIGVAETDGVSGDTIAYAISGVHYLPKVSGAVITQGEQVLWDVSAASSAGSVDDDQATPATGDFLCGVAMEDAGSGVLQVAVKINQPGASVT